MDSNINNSEQTVQVWTALASSRMVSPVFRLALSPARASELLQLTPIPPSTHGSLPSVGPASILSTFRPSVGVIVGVLTTMFAITFLLLLYAKHCTANSADTLRSDDEPATAPVPIVLDSGVDRAIIEALPIFSFASLRGPKEGLECAVCLGRYEDTETLRLLPKCKHAFHISCVDRWLGDHSTCPLCRNRVEATDLLLVDEFMSRSKSRENESGSVPNAAAAPATLKDEKIERALQVFVQREGDPGTSSTITLGAQDGIGSGRKDHAGGGTKEIVTDSSRNERRLEIGNGKLTGSSGRLGVIGRLGLSGRWKGWRWSGTERKDGLLLSDSLAQEDRLLRRLGHRIILSDVSFQPRWSDFVPSDVLFLNRSTLLGNGDRILLSEGKGPFLSTCRSVPAGQSKPSPTPLSGSAEPSIVATATRTDAEPSKLRASISESDLATYGELGSEVVGTSSHLVSRCRLEGKGASRSPRNIFKRTLSVGMWTDGHNLQSSRQRSYSEITGLHRFPARSPITECNNDRNETTTEWFSFAAKTLNWISGRGQKANYSSETGA